MLLVVVLLMVLLRSSMLLLLLLLVSASSSLLFVGWSCWSLWCWRYVLPGGVACCIQFDDENQLIDTMSLCVPPVERKGEQILVHPFFGVF
jgi:hypothetical protein